MQPDSPKVIATIRIQGKLSHGVIRGRELVEDFLDRLTGIIGWKCYPGTLNVKLEKELDIVDFETKRLEHVLLDGSKWIDARLAPAKLYYKGNPIEVWWIREERGIFHENLIELVAPEKLMEKYGMAFGDQVEVELQQLEVSSRNKLTQFWRKLFPKNKRIIK